MGSWSRVRGGRIPPKLGQMREPATCPSSIWAKISSKPGPKGEGHSLIPGFPLLTLLRECYRSVLSATGAIPVSIHRSAGSERVPRPRPQARPGKGALPGPLPLPPRTSVLSKSLIKPRQSAVVTFVKSVGRPRASSHSANARLPRCRSPRSFALFPISRCRR